MRIYFFQSLFFCLVVSASFAQPKELTLSGTIEVNSGEAFPYKIVFTEAGGVIKGYSLTYKEPDETKATIKGTLDRRNHTLSFKETDIVYSHGFHTKAFMCLIDASLEHIKESRGQLLIGPITSREADKTACTGGKIIFNNNEEVQKLFASQEKFDTVISMKKKVRDVPETIVKEETIKDAETLITEKITANIEKVYDWHSDTVVLDIWDGGSVDGDKITLQYNGKPLLVQYLLIKQKKQLRLPVSGHGTDVISIIADNEGTEPPNTASLMLTDGDTRYSVLAYNPKGRQAIIKIRKLK